MTKKARSFLSSKMKFSLSFVFAITAVLALGLGTIFMPITENVAFSSTNFLETDNDEVLRLQIALTNNGNSSVWINKSEVDSRLLWLQIFEINREGELTPFSGTGGRPTSWYEIKPSHNVVLNAELAGCGLNTNGNYAFAFSIEDWRGKEKLMFGRMSFEHDGLYSISRLDKRLGDEVGDSHKPKLTQ